MTATESASEQRTLAYWDYLIERGMVERYGPFWQTPERLERLEREKPIFIKAGYVTGSIMLSGVMDYCRQERIPYGACRGSAGGSLILYALGITEVDPLEWDLLFERFLNPDRVSFPDVDLDFSQRDRHRVLQWVVDKYNTGDQIVLQIGAFVRAGGRAVVDLMFAAMADSDPNAGATATNLKKCFPDEGSITGGQKLPRELHAWLYEGKGHGDKQRFIEIAEQAGWLETLLLLDGMFTHLGKHAAGVVILRKEDLPIMPLVTVRDTKGDKTSTLTAYDMYSLDDLGYPKWDFLGLRTLDVIADAHRFEGGTGDTRDLIELWRRHRDDPEPYQILQEADTVGIFQMETDGYRRTLRDFQPTCFDHIVQLVALYRPGALDYVREDGKNMVEVFIDRLHGREPVTYDHPLLKPILEPTLGIILYQEQQMKIAQELAGFTLAEADMLRKAIGKKRADEMKRLMVMFREGCAKNGIEPAVIERIAQNIEAAARYSWNKSHAVGYAIPTWHTIWFKHLRVGFYASLVNSWSEKKEKQANVIAEARQWVQFRPPDINIAEDSFTVSPDRKIVFGLNGIKGMGEANRNAILIERAIGGPFKSYEDFCQRLPSVPTNMKRSLVACGAFDSLGENRVQLLAQIPKGQPAWNTSLSCGCISRKLKQLRVGEQAKCSKHKTDAWVVGVEEIERKTWMVLEHVNESAKLVSEGRAPKPLPEITEFDFPTDAQLAQGEMDAMGYYISDVPMAALNHDLKILPAGTVGGEVAKIQVRQDRNGNDYADIQLITAALTKQRVLMFWSAWSTFKSRIEKGKQLLFRGRLDGDTLLADGCWPPGDYRHFRKIKVWKGDKPETSEFDGSAATVRSLEQAGYRIRLL